MFTSCNRGIILCLSIDLRIYNIEYFLPYKGAAGHEESWFF